MIRATVLILISAFFFTGSIFGLVTGYAILTLARDWIDRSVVEAVM